MPANEKLLTVHCFTHYTRLGESSQLAGQFISMNTSFSCELMPVTEKLLAVYNFTQYKIPEIKQLQAIWHQCVPHSPKPKKVEISNTQTSMPVTAHRKCMQIRKFRNSKQLCQWPTYAKNLKSWNFQYSDKYASDRTRGMHANSKFQELWTTMSLTTNKKNQSHLTSVCSPLIATRKHLLTYNIADRTRLQWKTLDQLMLN